MARAVRRVGGDTVTSQQVSHKHHYVPKILMKHWASQDGLLNGYCWNTRKGRLDCNRRGANAFCFKKDLLMLNKHDEGPDVLEQGFFSKVDTDGCIARDLLLREVPESLSNDQRCDFARLLLSLEARRPAMARRLRENSPQELASILDKDPILLHAMEAERLSMPPSAFVPPPHTISEHMFIRLVDNLKIGGNLINAHWRVVRLGPRDGTLILSDRPLVRLFGCENPKAAWFLPLSPKVVFSAAYSPIDFEGLTPRRLAKFLNADSVRQAQKYVFCVDDSHNRLLEKHLPPRHGA